MNLVDRIGTRIERKSRALASRFQFISSEELAQEMWVALISKVQDDPQFAAQTDAYILQYAEWQALEICRTMIRHSDIEQREFGERVDFDDEPGSREDIQDRLMEDARARVEENVILKVWLDEMAGLMSEDAEIIFWMVLAGYSKGEAAKLTGAADRVKNLASWVSKNVMPELEDLLYAELAIEAIS